MQNMNLHIMKNIKTLSPFLVSILALVLMSLLFLIPLDNVLSKISLSDFEIEYVQLGIKMSIVFFISNYLIKKLKM